MLIMVPWPLCSRFTTHSENPVEIPSRLNRIFRDLPFDSFDALAIRGQTVVLLYRLVNTGDFRREPPEASRPDGV